MMPEKFHYRCNDCDRTFSMDEVTYLCPVCASKNELGTPPFGVLHTEYDYDRIKGNGGSSLFETLRNEKFLSLLPVQSMDSYPLLAVGNSPMYEVADRNTGDEPVSVYLKDDSGNPTFSFKDRASALVSAWAVEHQIHTIVAASTGNAGSSLAGICASQKQKAIIFVPSAAPLAKLTQILMYGARIIPVDGTYDQAFDLSLEASARFGFYNRNTAYNPFTIEGKKTVSFEIFDQLKGSLPDRIFVPVGDGVIISGVYKGFFDLLKSGIIEKIPEIVAVQAEGSSNLIRNLDKTLFELQPAKTLADSIAVDIPRNFRMAARYIREFSGRTQTVSDSEILNASLELGHKFGLFSEPAAAAAYAGYLKFRNTVGLEKFSKNVVLLTGSGLKDLASVQSSIRMPEPVAPDFSSLDKIFKA